MQFCKKCGAIMPLGSGNVKCPKCGYSEKGENSLEIKEEINANQGVAVVNSEEGEMHPIMDHKCEKCGHDKAYFWLRQMRAGDEPESRFYRCVKCKNTVRED